MTRTADLLITDARIDPEASGAEPIERMAVADGRILALGEDASACAGPETRVVEMGGRAVLPGFADGHAHHLLAGQSDLFELQVSSSAGLDEVLEAVAAHAAGLGAGEWIVGGSWGSGLLEQLSAPEALARFDAACAGRPAMLRDDSKHNRWANSAALAAAGITASSPDPEGGEILRDVTGKPTGVLIEAAGLSVEEALIRQRPMTTEQTARAAARGIEILHSYGITAFQDAGASLPMLEALHHLDQAGRLEAWVVTSMLANDVIFGADPVGEGIIRHREQHRSRRHRPDFIKIFLDGVPPTRSAAFLEPYLPDELHGCDHRGHTTMDGDQLRSWLFSTAEQGISAKIHCTGDASVRTVLDVVEEVRRAGHAAPRYQIAHGQFVHPDDVPRFAALDVVADISPMLWFPGVIVDAVAAVLPSGATDRMQPNRELLEAGALLAAGSDWPVAESPNPWEAVYGLVTRKDPSGQRAGTLCPDQAITLAQAMAACTAGPVEAMGLGEETGRLRPGLSADFIVLAQSPYDVDVEELPTFVAEETWFAGEPVHVR
ncbi:amidohydrolase [Nesterenkonia sp. F]|uniref:amidohydrolase n=1 Tax=Nesterenkonia sp. F TaxID=795955 RepID=UPI000255CCE3|nr:amidohydrolase [Nesterenkonia sp. F]